MNRDDLVQLAADAIGANSPCVMSRDEARSLARAALALIEPAVREECARVADAKAVSLDAFAVGFAMMLSAAAPYAIRATDARDLAADICAGAKP